MNDGLPEGYDAWRTQSQEDDEAEKARRVARAYTKEDAADDERDRQRERDWEDRNEVYDDGSDDFE